VTHLEVAIDYVVCKTDSGINTIETNIKMIGINLEKRKSKKGGRRVKQKRNRMRSGRIIGDESMDLLAYNFVMFAGLHV
jgi:hypothetical protein